MTRTLASLRRQTARRVLVAVHVTAGTVAPNLPPQHSVRGARHAGRWLHLTVPAGTTLEPTAVEKLAWCLLSVPRASGVWAVAQPCGACSSQEPQGGSGRVPGALLAIRVDAAAPVNLVHLPETLAWGNEAGSIDDTVVSRPRVAVCLAQAPHSTCRPGESLTFDPGPTVTVPGGRRLLLAVPWLALGGADKFNLDAIRLLRERGWRVTIVTTLPGTDAWRQVFKEAGDEVFMLPRFVRLPDWPRLLAHLLRTRRPEALLSTNSEFTYHVLPAIRALAPDLRIADYCHMEQEGWKNGGYPRLAALSQPFLDVSLVSTEHLRDWLIRRGVSPSRLRVLHTNVDTTYWAPSVEVRREVRHALGVGEDDVLLLFAGRLDPQKQPEVLARTLGRLRARGVAFTAVVAGDGPDEERLRRELDASGAAAATRLLGAVSNEEVRRLLQASDIFFLPSQMEGLSLAIYEAMACGTCVVGAAVGGQPELVVRGTGVLVERGTPEDEVERYAAALERLIREPRRRLAMARAARARVVRHFPLEALGEQLHRVLSGGGKARLRRSRAATAVAAAHAHAAVEMTRLEGFLQALWHEREAGRAAAASGGAG